MREPWSSDQVDAFEKSEDRSTYVFEADFDPKLPLIVACDASAYGIEAVLADRMSDGSDRPIAYASRTLNSVERTYSQLEKEGLSLVFGIKCFYSYLFAIGHSFTLVTDHKLLLALLDGLRRFNSPRESDAGLST